MLSSMFALDVLHFAPEFPATNKGGEPCSEAGVGESHSSEGKKYLSNLHLDRSIDPVS